MRQRRAKRVLEAGLELGVLVREGLDLIFDGLLLLFLLNLGRLQLLMEGGEHALTGQPRSILSKFPHLRKLIHSLGLVARVLIRRHVA